MLKDKQENSEKKKCEEGRLFLILYVKKHPKHRYKNSNNWEKISAAFTKDCSL